MENINFKEAENISKSFANYSRLKILDLLSKNGDLTIESIGEKLNLGYENTSDHLRKLFLSGLISKKNKGWNVLHNITSKGRFIIAFCKKL